jgi:hypothetical protein
MSHSDNGYTYLFVEAQIVKTDGSDLDPDTDVGPVNLWMHSLFSDVSVSLNEKLVCLIFRSTWLSKYLS